MSTASCIALDLRLGSWHTAAAMSSLLSPKATVAARKPSHPNRFLTLPSLPDDERERENRAVGRGFSWLALGHIVNAACAWGRVALLARLGNSEMIGQLTLALAVCNPISTLADLGLSGSLISDAKRQYRLGDYLGLRLLTCGLAMLVIVVTAWMGGYDPTTARLVVLAGAIEGAQLPLHTWLYAAMEAPTSISALLHAATMVKAGVYLIARFILIIGIVSLLIPNWLATIVWVGVLTALVAGTLALSSPDVKGVQAYSTVSQLGFMIAALGTAVTSLSAGWFASLYQMVGHAFFQGLNFLLIGGIIHAVDTRDMRQMGGLRKRMPVTFILSIIYLITAIGLPPLPTFFSKELIISSIWASSSVFGSQSIVLGILIYIATGLTFAYALRYILMVFGGEESPYIKNVHVHESPKIMLIVASILAGLCLIFEFFGPLFRYFYASLNHG